MKAIEDGYKLSSGREFYANNGIIGIGPTLAVFHGYDGDFPDDEFTKAEKIELAEFMIMRWQLYYSMVRGT